MTENTSEKADLTQSYWDNRYEEKTDRWDLGEVSPPIKTYLDQLIDNEMAILVPGAGNSYETEYLHRIGFKNVIVLDLSSKAIANFKKRVPTFPTKHVINQNFFDLHGFFDLIVEQTFFCAIDKKLRPAYAKKMAELLNKGGKLVGLLFDAPLNQDHPPFGGSVVEYKTYFEPYFEIETIDPCYNSHETRAGREVWIKMIKK